MIENRTKSIRFKVTDKEFLRIKALAVIEQKSMSAFIRKNLIF
jgi:hypothetical protein